MRATNSFSLSGSFMDENFDAILLLATVGEKNTGSLRDKK